MKYICPMHPDVISDKPGQCPECGMNLVSGKEKRHHSEHAEHDKHAGHKTSSFLNKFWVALVLTLPIFLYSEMASMIFGIHAPTFFGYQYVFLALGSIIFFYCGWIFITSAYRELRAKLPGMMTLIAIAITTAYVYSFFSILFATGHDLLFENVI
jgi:Cu2+-exporting ATPase